jgi:hypothetical protein
MKKVIPLIIALAFASLPGASAQLIVKTIDQSELNLGWVQVFDLPSDGGAFQFGQPTGLANLVATFPTSTNVTLAPNNTITDPSTFWYSQPGDVGNKEIQSLLYSSANRGSLIGDTLSFEFIVTDYSLTTNSAGIPYTFGAIIQEFGNSYNQVFLPISGAGTFSVSMPLLVDPSTTYQWGFLLTGPNIWPGNTGEATAAGSVGLQAIPEPTTYALLGLAAVGGLIARRLRRNA